MTTATKKGITVEDVRSKIGLPFEIVLPSGIKMLVKRLTTWDFIQAGLGDIPNEFYMFIASLQVGKIDDTEENRKNLELLDKYMKVIVEQGVIQPPMCVVYDEAKKNSHLIYSELTQEDQEALTKNITGR